MKIMFLTVMPSPYQRQLFERISSDPLIDLSVIYYLDTMIERQWKLPNLAQYEQIINSLKDKNIFRRIVNRLRVIERINCCAPDLVIISDYSSLTAQLAMLYLKRKKIPWIFWGEVPGFAKRGPIGRWLRRQLQRPLRSANRIAGVGSVAVHAYQQLFPKIPVVNIPYFCDLSPYQYAASSQSPRAMQSTRILFSGQLIERKGVDVLIHAFSRVAELRVGADLWLLGEGDDRLKLESLIPEKLRGRVIFHGHKDPQALPEIFAKADIFCLPSQHDGWGVVVNEALGAGLPLIVSDAVGSGLDLIVDGKNGTVFPAGNVAALSEALANLIDHPEKRRRFAQGSRQMALAWSLDEGAARWRKAAQEVLKSKTP